MGVAVLFIFVAEKAEEFTVYAVGYHGEVLGTVQEVAVVFVDDDEATIVGGYPVFVALVKPREVVYADALLVFAATLLNLGNQSWDGGAQVYHEVWLGDKLHHEVEELGVVIKIAVGHHTHIVEVGGEDAGVLKDGAVLHHDVLSLGDGHYILETLVEEIDLQVERPPRHVGVEVCKVGIVFHGLKFRRPAVVLGQHTGQCRLAAADVACYCYVHSYEV